MNTPRLRTAAAATGLLLAATAFAAADRVQNPVHPAGEITLYSLTGKGDGQMVMPGSNQAMPLELETNVTLRREITDSKPDGTQTTEQAITDNAISINGQEIGIGKVPPVTVTTDPNGKVTGIKVKGEQAASPVGPSSVQTLMEMWQLPNREMKPGDTWTQTVPLSDQAGGSKTDPIALNQQYLGTKQVDGHPVLQMTTHLGAPVTVQPHRTVGAQGFTLTSLKVVSLDQTSNYDPATGSLLSAETKVNMEVGSKLGDLPMTVKMPLTVKTRLLKTEVGAVDANAGASPTGPSASSGAGSSPAGGSAPRTGQGPSKPGNALPPPPPPF